MYCKNSFLLKSDTYLQMFVHVCKYPYMRVFKHVHKHMYPQVDNRSLWTWDYGTFILLYTYILSTEIF